MPFILRKDFGRNPDAEPNCLLVLLTQLLLKWSLPSFQLKFGALSN